MSGARLPKISLQHHLCLSDNPPNGIAESRHHIFIDFLFCLCIFLYISRYFKHIFRMFRCTFSVCCLPGGLHWIPSGWCPVIRTMKPDTCICHPRPIKPTWWTCRTVICKSPGPRPQRGLWNTRKTPGVHRNTDQNSNSENVEICYSLEIWTEISTNIEVYKGKTRHRLHKSTDERQLIPNLRLREMLRPWP